MGFGRWSFDSFSVNYNFVKMKKILIILALIGIIVTPLLQSGDSVSAYDGGDISPLYRYLYGEPPQYIDNSWDAAALPWNWQMSGDDYRVRVKEDFTAGQIIEYTFGDDIVTFQPMALEWTNDLNQIQPISMPVNVTPIVSHEKTVLIDEVNNFQGFVLWQNAYGSDIDFKWQCTPGTLEKRLIINDVSALPVPQPFIIAGGNPALRLNLIFDPSNNLDIIVNGQPWNQKTTVQTFDFIQFQDDVTGETIFSFKPLRYWSSDATQDGETFATLDKKGNSLYISILVPYEWMQSAVYPVYIDADVTIEALAHTNLYFAPLRTGIFWVSTTTGYVFYLSDGADLVYQKTADGGANWGGQVEITGDNIVAFDCWADWQTPGDAGTKIHFAYLDETIDDIMYGYLETSDDSMGSDKVADAGGDGNIYNSLLIYRNFISITKAVGGNICVSYHHQDDSSAHIYEFYTSPDADTWTNENTPWDIDTIYDRLLLFPGNESDPNDIWCIYYDDSTSELSLKTYDDSLNSWSEQNITGSFNPGVGYVMFDGQVNLSTGHLYIAGWNELDLTTADLLFWDINGASSITAKTNLITNKDNCAQVSVFINQVNNDIYVAQIGKDDGSEAWTSVVHVYYFKSVDNGANWGAQTVLSVTNDDHRWVSAGCIKAAWGGKFMPVWFNDDLNDILCNTDNAVSIAAGAGGAAPDVTTGSASNIDCDSFDMWGIITDNHTGTTTTVGFYYGTGALTDNVTDTYSTDNFTLNISGLADNTEYMVQAFAINEYGLGTGDTENVTTLASSDPTFTTNAATLVLYTTARLNGTISGLDCDQADDVFWEWGLTTGNYTANYTDPTNYGNVSVYHDLTSLTENTTYYYRGAARLNGGAWQYGGELSFTTLVAPLICPSPINLSLSILPCNQIQAEWEAVAGITDYLVLVSTVDFPNDPEYTDAEYAIAYSGTSTSVILEGYETELTTYYFSLWTHCNPYSDDYVTASIGGVELEALSDSFQDFSILIIGIIVLIFFSVLAFWRDNSILFMLAAGVSIVVGFNCYDTEANTWMFGVALILWAYSIACLIFGFMCIFKRRPSD